MDLTPYVDGLRQELLAAAGGSDSEALALAERLAGSVASATRLSMLDVLSAAADEISRSLVPGSVEIRLRGLNPHFVVTSPSAYDALDDDPQPAPATSETTQAAAATEGAVGRINFRPPEQLKAQIEAAAAREGLSVNAWLVRVAAAAAAPTAAQQPPGRRGGLGPTRHYVGWVG